MTRPFITLIAAVAADGCIGRGGTLPFHLPHDLRRFRKLTRGKPVIMGRRTWESLPRRPLPDRHNIVISRTMESAEGATVTASFASALEAAGQAPEVMVIGGASVYAAALPSADCLEITRVMLDVPDGDTFFPDFGQDASWFLFRGEEMPPGDGPAATYRTHLRRPSI